MILYDVILFLLTLFVSIRKPHHFRRLFAAIPKPQGKEVIWIHAVSVGETKSAQTLFQALKKDHPQAFFLITTTTVTGQAEARRSLSSADAFAFLPIDLSFIVRRWVDKLRPKLFFLVESDFWPNLLSAIRKKGGKVLLVSGKISKRSVQRFSWFPSFSKKLFDCIDCLCVQNEAYAERFLAFKDRSHIHIGGNLKLDHRPQHVDVSFWRRKLLISDPAITLSCTHAPEEEKLIDLLPLDQCFLFLAPRHPERFTEVAEILQRKKIPYFRWTRPMDRRGGERVLLMDVMGQLPICYALSRLSIVAGSFEPRIGGHNILEPCLYGVPVFFGPYMDAQQELVRQVLNAKAGIQSNYSSLRTTIQTFFTTSSQEAAMRSAAVLLAESSRGATLATYQLIRPFF
ncbi:MAG TPA: glycosyltransferase N-terminal domain-containing protein [Chlamydiales bacterium]|nr:glycosyltransferase N-terminal domain-containing protein [Chlamydiales bacterium]